MDPVIVYARWAGYGDKRSQPPTPYELRPHIYSSAIPPAHPLKIGTRVRILATSPAWYTAPTGDLDAYEAYDAHIVGTIAGVVGWKGRKIILKVENECAINTVRTAHLRVPFAPEVTVDMSLEDVPEGRREAHEADLNTSAVVKTYADGPRCNAQACCPPWRKLVRDHFLQELMVEDVSDRSGADGGKTKMKVYIVSWKSVSDAEARNASYRAPSL